MARTSRRAATATAITCGCSSGCPATRRGPELADAAVRRSRQSHARLCLALPFVLPPGGRAGAALEPPRRAALRPLLEEIADPGRRGARGAHARPLRERVLPQWPRLRAQVVARRLQPRQPPARRARPGLRDPRLRRLLPHGARGATSPSRWRRSCAGGRRRRSFRVARIALDGFASRLPARAARARAARRPRRGAARGDRLDQRLALLAASPRTPAYIEAWDDDSWRLLELFDGLGPEEVARELGARRGPARPSRSSRGGANEALGALLTPLTYRAARPRRSRRGRLDLRSRTGQRLLDAYNNVPVVGHCHPRVTEAVVRQTRLLSDSTRATSPSRWSSSPSGCSRRFPPEAGARHGAARQLRQRGERPRVAARRWRDRAATGRS